MGRNVNKQNQNQNQNQYLFIVGNLYKEQHKLCIALTDIT